jgi:hypothetical protein
MAYALNVEERTGYLCISVTGDNSVETVRDYLAEARRLCLLRQVSDVLIVENLAGASLDLASIYAIASDSSPQARERLGRIAYVDINPGHNPADMEFAEDVAVNRGLHIKVFRTVQAAEAWLEGPQKH